MTLDALTLDDRSYALDADRRVAEVALQGQLPGTWAYLTPTPAWAAAGRVSLRAAPQDGANQVSEAVLGEALEVIEPLGEWAWVRTLHDGYLGYARADGLTDRAAQATMPVMALRAHLYDAPAVSARVLDEVAFGAHLAILGVQEVRGRDWYEVAYRGGRAFIGKACFEAPPGDVVDFALRFLDTPYVWGGRTAWGLDCSGLSQLVYARAGLGIPRDADQQQAHLTPVSTPEPGDLAFFPGHVGIMLDGRRMLHANATHMAVSIEVLGEGRYGQRLAADLQGFGRWPEDRA